MRYRVVGVLCGLALSGFSASVLADNGTGSVVSSPVVSSPMLSGTGSATATTVSGTGAMALGDRIPSGDSGTLMPIASNGFSDTVDLSAGRIGAYEKSNAESAEYFW